MLEIADDDASNQSATLLDRVANGEVITFTRDGQPVARLAPRGPSADLADAVSEEDMSTVAIGSRRRFDAERRTQWAKSTYPCTIVLDRYSGVYSGGKWIAYPLDPEDVPFAVVGDDNTCSEFWWDHNANDRLLPVGRGTTPMSAFENLVAVMRGSECEDPEQAVATESNGDGNDG